MDFIRRQRSHSSHDPNTKHVIYGLDADLIMLSLATHEPHFRVLREDVFAQDKKGRGCHTCGQPGHHSKDCTGTSWPERAETNADAHHPSRAPQVNRKKSSPDKSTSRSPNPSLSNPSSSSTFPSYANTFPSNSPLSSIPSPSVSNEPSTIGFSSSFS